MIDVKVYNQYLAAFDVINTVLFNAELPRTAIGFIKTEEARKELAKKKRGAIRYDHENKCLIIYFTSYPKDGILSSDIDVMFHEMVHLYAYIHGIKDIDKNNGYQYHNEQFQRIVLEHCGICKYDSQYGFVNTKLPSALKKKILITANNLLKWSEIRNAEKYTIR